jgi:hypothetical protein
MEQHPPCKPGYGREERGVQGGEEASRIRPPVPIKGAASLGGPLAWRNL